MATKASHFILFPGQFSAAPPRWGSVAVPESVIPACF